MSRHWNVVKPRSYDSIIKEMIEIEQFRRELEVHSGRALKKLRIVRSSKRLNTFIEENNLWHCNWNMLYGSCVIVLEKIMSWN